jgi:hypothetical protein
MVIPFTMTCVDFINVGDVIITVPDNRKSSELVEITAIGHNRIPETSRTFWHLEGFALSDDQPYTANLGEGDELAYVKPRDVVKPSLVPR